MAIAITAARYNILRDTINQVMGTSMLSAPTFGYGQTTPAPALLGNYDTNLINTNKATPQEYELIYTLLLRARIHQVGTAGISPLPLPEGGYITNTSADVIEEAYMIALETLAANIQTDRYLIHQTQSAAELLTDINTASIASTRQQSVQGTWNGVISHIYDVTFLNTTSRRHFFNAGGQLRLSAESNYTGTQQKSLDWKNSLNSNGLIGIGANATTNLNSVGSPTANGNYQLASSYLLMYRSPAGPSGLYTNNFYEIHALELTSTTIRIKVSFIDGSPNNTSYGIDEAVFGDFSSVPGLLVPDGTTVINGASVDTVVYSDTITGNTVSAL